MAVGNQTTEAAVNEDLTSASTQLRDLAALILEKQAYYDKLGVAGLTDLGFQSAEAQAVLDNWNHMATPMQVYKGEAAQPEPFDFEDFLTPLWGGR